MTLGVGAPVSPPDDDSTDDESDGEPTTPPLFVPVPSEDPWMMMGAMFAASASVSGGAAPIGETTVPWRVVRFLRAGTTIWYPDEDNLAGTSSARGVPGNEYGFSVPFGDHTQVMLATGNFEHWLIVTKDELARISTITGEVPGQVVRSSKNHLPHTVKWKTGSAVARPFISVSDFNTDTDMVYAENSWDVGKSSNLIRLDPRIGALVLVR